MSSPTVLLILVEYPVRGRPAGTTHLERQPAGLSNVRKNHNERPI